MKTRIKMHQMPGDVSKQEKIQMMEGNSDPSSIQFSKKRSKSFRKMILARERAVLNQRIQKDILEEIELC